MIFFTNSGIRDNNRKYPKSELSDTKGGMSLAEEVMGPVFVMLVGAVLIALGLLFASSLVLWIRILFGLGGVATILLGMVMLFGIAYRNPKKT